jgi:7-cyano-7-deazaguanine synthase
MALRACDEAEAASFYYGSKHNNVESDAALAVAKYYKIKRHYIVLPDIFGGAGSALMGEVEMPVLTYKEIDEGVGPSPTVVPFRNANMLSMATTLAITNKCDFVYAGMHAEDAHHWAYPDCSPEFIGAMANAIYVGSYHEVRLITPIEWMMKADVVYSALHLKVPLGLTWSCYDPKLQTEPSTIKGYLPVACGKCPTCVERINAFKVNELIDPIVYDIPIEWPDWFCRYPRFPGSEEV